MRNSKTSLVLVVVAACGSRGEPTAAKDDARPAPTRRERVAPIGPVSTVTARDYIGPDACGECHPEQHAPWTQSLHRVMNQRAEGGAVIGDFGGVVVPYAGGEARFQRDAKGYTMTLAKAGRTVRYRVTRTIGRRALQEYVGVEEATAAGPGRGDARGERGDEVRLPFGWWPRRRGWYPQPYFDPWLAEDAFDAYAPVREPWAERCPWCHSTYAFEQRIARASARAVGHGLEQHFTSAPGTDRLAVAAQVTVGISCESCHLGGRAHKDGAPIHFVPQGAAPRPGAPAPTTFAEERKTPAIVNTVCAQCHSGPSPRLADGAALRNSSEALDLAASACTAARCVDCHDPHRGGVDEARAVAACTGCHRTAAEAGRTHTGHDGVSCLDCHMPKIVMGVDRFVRSHRISSPTDARLFASAAPNACNLCHLDRSIRWTVDELARQYEVTLEPTAWTAYGDLDEPVGQVWLASKEPAFRLVAGAAFARAATRGLAPFAIPALLRGLADPLAHVRAWTVFAVEDVLGRRLTEAEYDPRLPAAERGRQLARVRALLTERVRARAPRDPGSER